LLLDGLFVTGIKNNELLLQNPGTLEINYILAFLVLYTFLHNDNDPATKYILKISENVFEIDYPD